MKNKSLIIAMLMTLIMIMVGGTVYAAEPILMEETYQNAWVNINLLGYERYTGDYALSSVKRANINTITILDTNAEAEPSTYVASWDVSKANDGSVTAWLVEEVTYTTKYHLYIGGEGGVIVSDAMYLFAYYTNCKSITGISNLDTSRVTSMKYMFYSDAGLTELDLSTLNTSNVTDMDYMFKNCANLTSLKVNNFDTKNVTTMYQMFYSCCSLTGLNLKSFNTSKITNMESMFASCGSLIGLDLSSFDTSKVTNMNSMFKGCYELINLNLSSFNTSNVLSMKEMFRSCISLTSLNLNNFNTSKVTDMQGMFNYCSALNEIYVSSFDTKNVKSMAYMFYYCSGLTNLNLINFDTSSVTNMDYMFYGSNGLYNILLGDKFDRIIGKDMFASSNKYSYYALSKIITTRTQPMNIRNANNELADIEFSGVIYVPNKTIESTWENNEDYAEHFGFTVGEDSPKIEQILDLYGNEETTLLEDDTYDESATAAGYKSTTNEDITPKEITNYGYVLTQTSNNVNLSKLGDYEVTYKLTLNGTTVDTITRNVHVKEGEGILMVDEYKKASGGYLLGYERYGGSFNLAGIKRSYIKTITILDTEIDKLPSEVVASWDVSQSQDRSVTAWLVQDTTSTADYHLYIGGKGGVKVSNAGFLFAYYTYCTDIKGLEKLDTSKANYMFDMFENSKNITTLDLSGLDTSSATRMDSMFYGCSKLTSINLSSFDTSKVTNMDDMFQNCPKLTTLFLGDKFDKLYSRYNMFYETENIEAIISTRTEPMLVSKDIGILSYSKNAVFYVPNETVEEACEADSNYAGMLDFKKGEDSAKIEPILGLCGSEKLTVKLNGTYDESATVAGFKQIYGADITPVEVRQYGYKLTQTSNNVDLTKLGEYEVTYQLTLNGVEVDTITREVKVLEKLEPILMEEKGDTSSNVIGDAEGVIGGERYKGTPDLTSLDRANIKKITILDTSVDTIPTSYVASWDVSKENNGSVTAWLVRDASSTSSRTYYQLYIGGEGGVIASSGYYLFYEYGCTEIIGLEKLDTSNVTNMKGMFEYCSYLTSIDLTSFDFSNVTNTERMFYYCPRLEEINLSNLNANQLEFANSMFASCGKLRTLNLTNFIAKNLKNINAMFASCTSLTKLNLNGFGTDQITNGAMNRLFDGCTNLKEIYLPEDFSSINGAFMFANTPNLKTIISNKSEVMNIIGSDSVTVAYNGLGGTPPSEIEKNQTEYYSIIENKNAIIYVPTEEIEALYEANSHYATILEFNVGEDSPRIEPILKLNDGNKVVVGVGGSYDEIATVAGYEAITGSDITPTEVKEYGYVLTQTSNNVNLTSPGEYTVTYRLTLNGVEVDTATRNVQVVKESVVLIEDDVVIGRYATINEAVSAARIGNENSSIIKISKDISMTANVIIDSNKNIVLDLSGHTIDISSITYSDNSGKIFANSGRFEITDSSTAKTGTINKTIPTSITICNTNTGELIINGGNIQNEEHSDAIIHNSGKTTINSGIISNSMSGGNATIYNAVETANLVINGGAISSDNSPTIGAYGGIVEINDGNISNSSVMAIDHKNGSVIINGGTITGTGNTPTITQYAGTLEVNGGTISSTNHHAIWNANNASLITKIGSENMEVNKMSPEIIGSSYGVYGNFSFYNGIIKGAAWPPYYNEPTTREGYIVLSDKRSEPYSSYLISEAAEDSNIVVTINGTVVGMCKNLYEVFSLTEDQTETLLATVIKSYDEDYMYSYPWTYNDLIIDLNGNTINNVAGMYASGDDTLEIRDSVGTGKISFRENAYIAAYGDVILKNVTLEKICDDSIAYVVYAVHGDIIVEDCVIKAVSNKSSANGIRVHSYYEDSHVDIINTEMTVEAYGRATGFNFGGSALLTIAGASKIIVTSETDIGYGIDANSTGHVQIGINDGNVSITEPYIYGSTSGIYTYGEIYNGKYDFSFYDGALYGQTNQGLHWVYPNDTSGYYMNLALPTGYNVIREDLGDGREKAILDNNYVMLIEDGVVIDKYATINEAVAAARTGNANSSTIKVLMDMSMSTNVVIPEDKNITLDLDGNVITVSSITYSDGSGKIFDNNGYFEIRDSSEEKTGAITQSAPGMSLIYNETNGELVISDGTITQSGSLTALLYNTGKATINNGTLNNTYGGTATVYNASSAELTINNGTVLSSYSPNVGVYGGEVIINGGTIYNSGSAPAVAQYDGKLQINSGTIVNTSLYGVWTTGTTAITKIGSADDELSTTAPEIIGYQYGVYASNNTFEFNNGIIKGTYNPPYYGTINPRESYTSMSQYNYSESRYNLTLVPSAVQLIEDNVLVGEYMNIPLAIAAARTNNETPSVIKLIKSFDNSTYSNTYTNRNIILDLNGIKAKEQRISIGASKLEIIDSVGSGELTTYIDSYNGSDVTLTSGTLRDVQLTSSSTISQTIFNDYDSTFTMNGGKIYGGIGQSAETPIYINDGEIYVESENDICAIQFSGSGPVYIRGGKISAISKNGTGMLMNLGMGAVITIGNDDGIINPESPILYGSTYGFVGGGYKEKQVCFYDGAIYGGGAGKALNTPTHIYETPEGYGIRKEVLEDGREKAYLVDTIVALIEDDVVVGTYNTINEAFEAARTGNTSPSTVKVFIDTNISQNIIVGSDKNIILDLNGSTVTVNSITYSDNSGNVISNNGYLEITDSTAGKSGKLQLQASGAALINNTSSGRLVINDGTLISYAGTAVANNGGNLEVNGGHVASMSTVAIHSEGSNAITKIGSLDKELSKTSPEIIGKTNAITGNFYFYNGILKNSTSDVYAKEPTAIRTGAVISRVVQSSTHVAYLIPEENVNVHVLENGIVIGKYANLCDALNSTISGTKTVKVIKDHIADEGSYTNYVQIGNGQNITLDLNGKKVTNQYGNITIQGLAQLEVIDTLGNGEYASNGAGVTAFKIKGGSMTLTSGTLTGEVGWINSFISTEYNANGSKFIMNGGKIHAISEEYRAYAIRQYDAPETGGYIAINGGEIIVEGLGEIVGIMASEGENAPIYINGGTITATSTNGQGYGLNVSNSEKTFIIGNDDGNVQSTPIISGSTAGIYDSRTNEYMGEYVVRFNDGVIYGPADNALKIQEECIDTPEKTIVLKEALNDGRQKAYLIADNEKPTIERVTATNEPEAKAQTITLINVEDVGGGVVAYAYNTTGKVPSVDSNEWNKIERTNGPIDISLEVGGNGTWYIWVIDMAKNVSEAKSIEIENIVPDVQLIEDGVIIGEFSSIHDAYEAARTGSNNTSIIKILRDITLENILTIETDKNITIDLNGKTLTTAAENADAIINNGILEIKDSAGNGKISHNHAGASKLIVNNEKFILSSGTLEIARTDNQSGNYLYGIYNYGNLSITDGNICIDTTNKYAYGIYNNSEEDIVISGGNIIINTYYDAYGIYNYYGGNVEISGGNIEASSEDDYAYGIYNYNDYIGDITISNGNIEANSGYYSYGIYQYYGGNTNIVGGTISGNGYCPTGIYQYSSGNIEMTGGEINVHSDDNYYSTGIYNEYSGTTSITGGKINATGYGYGIYEYSSQGITLGTNDGDVSIKTPIIYADYYGIYSDSYLNFYDGVVYGVPGYAVYISDTNIIMPNGYEMVAEETEDGLEMVYLDTSIKITENPQDVNVKAGNEASFSVTATGKNLNYQWYEVSGETTTKLGESIKEYRSNIEGQANTTASTTIKIKAEEAGILSFDYMVSSEAAKDTFAVTVADGSGTTTAVNGISGEVDWTTYTKEVTPNGSGEIVLTLTYSKNGSVDSGLDYGAIKNLKFTTGGIGFVDCKYVTDDYYTVTTPHQEILTTLWGPMPYNDLPDDGWMTETEDGVTIFSDALKGYYTQQGTQYPFTYNTASIELNVDKETPIEFEYRLISPAGYGNLIIAISDGNGGKIIYQSATDSNGWLKYSGTVTPDANGKATILLVSGGIFQYVGPTGYVGYGSIRNLKYETNAIVDKVCNFKNDDIYTITSTNWRATPSYSGTATSTLTIPGELVTSDKNGNEYYCVVSNQYGELESARATLNVYRGELPILMEESYSSAVANSYIIGAERYVGDVNVKEIKRNSIKTITILDTNIDTIPSGAIASWDASEEEDGSVTAWIVPEVIDGTNMYHLYIGGDGGVLAPENSVYKFAYYKSCTEIKGLGKFNTSRTTDMSSMFTSSSLLTNLDLSSWNTSNVTDMGSMFSGCTALTSVNLNGWNTSKVTNMRGMFSSCSNIVNIDLTPFNNNGSNTNKLKNMQMMFMRCSNLEGVNMSNFDASNVTNMSDMFYECLALETFDLSNLNLANVSNMSSMFQKCTSLKTVNLSGLNTVSLKNMSSMFSGCTSLNNLNLNGFCTESVTDMSYLFSKCTSLEKLNLSGFDTTNVTTMYYMFNNCSNLTELDLRNFNTTNVTEMGLMFYYCSRLKVILLGDDFDRIISSGMFAYISNKGAVISTRTTPMTVTNANGEIVNSSIEKLYVPNETVESAYEQDSNYASLLKFTVGEDSTAIEPILGLDGGNEIVLMVGETYNEVATVAGFKSTTEADITPVEVKGCGYKLIQKSNNVDLTKNGEYEVTYLLTLDGEEVDTITRKVRLVAPNYSVNGVYYETLADAIEAIVSEGTIVVENSNTDNSEAIIPEEKKITLNTNGKSITKVTHEIVNNGTLAIEGTGEIKTEDVINNEISVLIKNAGDLLINDATLIHNGIPTEHWVVIKNVSETAKITLNDGKLVATCMEDIYTGEYTARGVDVNGGIFNIIDGSIVSDDIAIYAKDSSTMTIGTKDGNVSITAPEIVGANIAIAMDNEGILNFYDGILKAKNTIFDETVNPAEVELKHNIRYSTETINNELYKTAYLVVGNYSVNGVPYATLVDAIAAISTEGTIIVENDNFTDDSNASISNKKNIILDMNGNTINKTTNAIYVGVGSVLNIKGEGTITGGTNHNVILNEGTFNLIDATIRSEDSTQTYYAIRNKGMLIVTSGVVSARGTAIYNTSITNVSGGEIIGTGDSEGNFDKKYVRAIYNINGELYITGGKISAENPGSSYGVRAVGGYGGNIEIIGGEIIANAPVSATAVENYATSSGTSGNINISGNAVITATATGTSGQAIALQVNCKDGYTQQTNVTIKGGTLTATTSGKTAYGVDMEKNTGDLVITGGTITSNVQGINIAADHTGNVTIGTNDETVTKDTPIIQGETYGITSASDVNFYDGIFKGKMAGMNVTGTIKTPEGYVVLKGAEGDYKTAYLSDVFVKNIPLITEWTIPANTTIKLPISANGNNSYTVDWGDGIVETFTSEAFPSHKYTNTEEKTYTIRIAGKVDRFGTVEWTAPTADNNYYTFTQYLTGLKAWGELGATSYGFANCVNLTGSVPAASDNTFVNESDFNSLFLNCKKITILPENLFASANTSKSINFNNSFNGCSGLVSVPETLFDGARSAVGFYGTFQNCSGLTSIPEGLFNNNTKAETFALTFLGCTSLTQIPEDLFANNTNVTSFESTFNACTGITSIPAGLFSNNSKVKQYNATFYGCSGLTGDIPRDLFGNTVEVTTYGGMFNGCVKLTGGELLIDTSNNPDLSTMFWNCPSITTLILGDCFKNINGSGMFNGDNNLKALILSNNATATSEVGTLGALNTINLPSSTIIYVPTEVAEGIYEQAWNGIISAERIEPILALEGQEEVTLSSGLTYTEDGYTVAGYNIDNKAEYEKYGYTVTISDNTANGVGKIVRTYKLIRKINNVEEEIMTLTRNILMFDEQKALVTEWTIPANADADGNGTTIKLPIPANEANNYTVDWGDGTIEAYTNADFPTHEYKNTTETKYTIKVSGTVYEFGHCSGATPDLTNEYANYYTACQYITGLKQWGEIEARRYGFSGCINLSGTIPAPTENSMKNLTNAAVLFRNCSKLQGTIPENLFEGATAVEDFGSVFEFCRGLTGAIPENLFVTNVNAKVFTSAFRDTGLSGTIPSDLFANNKKATTFSYTFADNNNLTTIGEGLFDANTEVTDFGSTFENCKGLTSIPNGLFAGKSKATNFRAVFFTCNGITSAIPGDLFDGCTAAESFELAFANCSKISGNIPETLFEDSLNVKTFSGLFEGCAGLTGEIPAGLFKNNKKVENLRTVFFNCTGLTGGEVLLDTSNVTNADMMFWNCSNMTTLILGEDFKKLDAGGLFGACNKLKAIIMLNNATSTSDVATLGVLSTINLPDATIIYVPTSEAEAIYESAWSNKIAADRVEPMIKLIGLEEVRVDQASDFVEQGYIVAGYTETQKDEYTKYGYAVTTSTSDPIDEVGSYRITYTLTREADGIIKIIDTIDRSIYVNAHIEVSIGTNNTSGTYAKDGDTISVTVTSNKKIGAVPQVIIAGKEATLTPTEAGEKEYVATIIVDNSCVEGEVSILVTGHEDEFGNKCNDITNITDGTVVYIDKTAPSTSAPEIVSKTENTIKVQNKQQDNMSNVFNSTIVKVEYAIKESSAVMWEEYQDSDIFTNLKVGTEYDIKTRATDAAGNLSESEVLSKVVTENITSGDIKFTTNTNEWTNQDVDVTIIWPETTLEKYYRINDGEWVLVTGDTTLVKATEYEDVITAKLMNGSLNEITNSIMISNIDKKKPTVTATVPNDWTNVGKTITVMGSDNQHGSGIAGYYITTDGDYIPVKDNFIATTSDSYTFVKPMGTYYIWAIDAAGNISENPYSIEVTNIETQKPVITYVNANVIAANKNDTVEIVFKATDNNPGLISSLDKLDIKVYIGDTVVVPTNMELTTEKSGDEIIYTLKINGLTGNGELSLEIAENIVIDIAGNANDMTKLDTPIVIDNKNPEKPTVTVSPDDEVVSGDVTITVDTKPDEKYEYSTDGGETWQDVIDGEIIINKEGETEVLIRAEDVAGNKSESTEVNVNIDTKRPMLETPEIIIPTDDEGNEKEQVKDGDEVVIKIPVDDDTKVTVDDDKVKVTIGGEEITTEDIKIVTDPDTNKPVITITVPVDADKEGEIAVELEKGAVTDEAGNPSDETVINTGAIVDNTKPEVTITGPGGEYKAGDKITYIIEINEENKYNIDEDKIVVTGGTIENIDTSTSGKIVVSVIVGSGDGEIVFAAQEGLIKDNAGNTSEMKSDNSAIADNAAPIINGATINNGATTTTEVGVTVQIDATNADWMFVTNDDKSLTDVMGLPEGSNGWLPFADETLHELLQGDGEKIVYVWVKDNAGNITGPEEVKITLSATTIGNRQDKEVVNGNEKTTSTNTNKTTIKFKVSDANFYSSTVLGENIVMFVNNSECATVRFTNIAGQATTNGTVYEAVITDVSGDGKLAIGLKDAVVKDKAGNILATTTTPVTTDITVDNTAPTLTVTSNAITVSDANLVGVMLNGKLIRTTNGTTNITIPVGAIVKAIDKAGNTTTVTR